MPTLREIFSNIADAIRTKTGKSNYIYPVDMASEIEGISSGGGYKLEKMPSGAVSSFNDGTDLPLNKLKVSIEPIQSGSGDPSPKNVRPISGHTEANIVVSPTTDAEDGQTYTIPFTDSQGNPITVYGGKLDVVSGVLTVDRAYVDLGSPTWGYTNGRFYYNSTDAKMYAQLEVANMLCSQYPTSQYTSQADNSISSYAGYIYARADSYSGDTSAFKTAMNGVQLVYELATPITYQLTPTAVKSLFGNNNIWADTGDIINGEYFKGAESSGSGIIYYIKNIKIDCEVI